MTTEKAMCMEKERMMALLGLAANRPKPAGTCPPAEQLSAFIDGRLSRTQHQAILAHLNSCERCYQEWLEAALTVAELEPKPVPSRRQRWWQKLVETCRTPWTLPLAAALAASFVVAAIVVQKPFQETWQIPQLAAMVRSHPGLDQALQAPPQPEGPAFAFSDSPQDPVKQAFSMGFQQARGWFDGSGSPVQEQAAWQRSPWRDYYDLGQWTFLLWVLTQAEDVSAKEWQAFDHHCQNLIARFERRPEESAARQAVASLQEIRTLLDQLAQQPSADQKIRLTRKLQWTIRQFLS